MRRSSRARTVPAHAVTVTPSIGPGMGCGLVPPRPLRAWFRSQSLDALPSREKEEPSDRCASHTKRYFTENVVARRPLRPALRNACRAMVPLLVLLLEPSSSRWLAQLPLRWVRTDDAISKPEHLSPAAYRFSLPYPHAMCVHWRRSPLCRAMLPPPLITPRTASMPRSPLRTALLPVSFASGSSRRSHRRPLPWRRCASARCGRSSR